MIEKLPEIQIHSCAKLNEKLNKVIDVVNELQTEVNKMAQNLNFAQPEVKENVGPYAEQRRWIGKLCRFYDSVYDRYYFDTLKGITDEGLFIGHNGVWKHCEPVKADSDIIYKGCDNEK